MRRQLGKAPGFSEVFRQAARASSEATDALVLASLADGGRLRAGMTATVGIAGRSLGARVESVAGYPVPREQLASQVGHAALAAMLNPDPAVLPVRLRLEPAANGEASGQPLASGTLCQATITLRSDRPITRLLPSSVTHLAIIPDDALWNLPFSALPYRGRPMIERFSLSFLPALRFSLRPAQRLRSRSALGVAATGRDNAAPLGSTEVGFCTTAGLYGDKARPSKGAPPDTDAPPASGLRTSSSVMSKSSSTVSTAPGALISSVTCGCRARKRGKCLASWCTAMAGGTSTRTWPSEWRA